jgi:hypothetical protein
MWCKYCSVARNTLATPRLAARTAKTGTTSSIRTFVRVADDVLLDFDGIA